MADHALKGGWDLAGAGGIVWAKQGVNHLPQSSVVSSDFCKGVLCSLHEC